MQFLQAGALQAFLGGLSPELHGMFDVFVVGLGKRARLDDVIDGENRVAFVNLGVIDDAHHRFDLALGNVEHALHVVLHVLPSDRMGRQRRRRGDDRGVRCCGRFSGAITHGFHQSP
jgi:hypothetical protein